jgi:predicted metal-dependent hydrolase
MRTELPGEPPIAVTVRHAPRARRISLRVSRRDGRVTLSVPPGATMSEAMGFARDREAWLRRALASVPPRQRPRIGGSLPVEGMVHSIVSGAGRRVRRAEGALHVPTALSVGPALARHLTALARARGEAAVARHAGAVGRPVPPLRLRDTRSRWGSCTDAGNVMLSWRLAMAPPRILDYVAAHEVAHLVHLDHSPAFWMLAGRLYPEWREARTWLGRHGVSLQAIDFT